MNKGKKELQPKLQNKLNEEFKNYKNQLLKETKENIFEQSYQTNIKEEIKDFIFEISTQLSINDLESLYNTKDILNILYNDWLKYDSPFSTYLENCIFESVENIKKKYLEDYEK